MKEDKDYERKLHYETKFKVFFYERVNMQHYMQHFYIKSKNNVE